MPLLHNENDFVIYIYSICNDHSCTLHIVNVGLLIEPSYDYKMLLKKKRKAKSLNVCLATKNVPHEAEFYNYDMVGGIKGMISGV